MNKKGTSLWNAFEGILKFITYKILHINLADETWEKFMQFVKFAMVGFSNVIVSYGVYLIFFWIFQTIGILPNTDYLAAQLAGYVLSIFLNSALSVLWVQAVGVPKIIAPIINLVINVPVNFLLNKFWAFGKCK